MSISPEENMRRCVFTGHDKDDQPHVVDVQQDILTPLDPHEADIVRAREQAPLPIRVQIARRSGQGLGRVVLEGGNS